MGHSINIHPTMHPSIYLSDPVAYQLCARADSIFVTCPADWSSEEMRLQGQ